MGALGGEGIHDSLYLSCIDFVARLWYPQLRRPASSVITDVSYVCFEGVDWRLPDGVGVSLMASVTVGVVLLESAETGQGFLIVWGIDDPAPSSVVVLSFFFQTEMKLSCWRTSNEISEGLCGANFKSIFW